MKYISPKQTHIIKKILSFFSFILIVNVILAFTNLNISNNNEKNQEEIDPKYTWDLTHIYKNEEKWEADFILVEQSISHYKKFEGTLDKSPKKLLNYLQYDDEIGKKIGLLNLYAKLSRDLDIQSEKNKKRWDKIQSLKNKITRAKSFAVPEILKIPNGKIESYITKEVQLRIYSHMLMNIIKTKKHILNQEQEHLLSLSSPTANIPSKIYFEMMVDIKFPKIDDDKGNEIVLSGLNWEASKVSFDRNFRERAYKGFFIPFIEQKNTISALLNGRLQSKIFSARARNFNSAMEASLLPNNIPVSVYNNLIKSVSANTAPMHRWMSLKKKALKLDEFYTFDSYMTIFSSNDKTYTFEEAKNIIIESFKPLGKEYISDLKMAFNSRWVDVYPKKGKAIGAYSSGSTYGTHPYVLINWTGTTTDLIELAHEMGHCMHAYYTSISQPYIYANYSSFAGEVASTTNEALLMRYLIANAKTTDEKALQIEKYLNNVRDIFYWTAMASEFEKTIYEEVESGQELTSNQFCKIIKELSAKYYGKDVNITEEETYIWAPLRHLYIVDFYLYQYAIGFAASEQITTKIEENPEAIEAYLNFLKAGSSKYPIDAIKMAGVDMNSIEPVLAVTKKMNNLLSLFEEVIHTGN